MKTRIYATPAVKGLMHSLTMYYIYMSITGNHTQPFKPSRCIKASFYIPDNRPDFPTTKGFRLKIPMKLVYQYMVIFCNFSVTSNHFHSLQVENCDSNSRLVVDEDDYGKLRLERVKQPEILSIRIFTYAKSVQFFIRYFMNSCCTILQTHVRIEINLVCS